MCQSASRAKLILGLSSTSKVEDLWTTRLGTAYCQCFPFSLIVVALGAMQNSFHLITTVVNRYSSFVSASIPSVHPVESDPTSRLCKHAEAGGAPVNIELENQSTKVAGVELI